METVSESDGLAKIRAATALMKEQNRRLNIARGLPGDYRPSVDELTARAAVMRAENDLLEAQAILEATLQAGGAA